MADFKTHIAFSSVLGIGYGATAYALFDVPIPTCVLAGGLCGVSGMLPDIDSGPGVPLRESMAFAAAVVPMMLIPRFPQLGMSSELIVLAGAGIYLMIRFVIAGQQPGVLVGPCLALYKLLSLIALARTLGVDEDHPVLPLFWIASHDSDRDEVASVVIPGKEGEPEGHVFPFPERHHRYQVGGLPLSPERWSTFVDEIGERLPPTEHREPLLRELKLLLSEEISLSAHFLRLCRFLLAAGESENHGEQ